MDKYIRQKVDNILQSIATSNPEKAFILAVHRLKAQYPSEWPTPKDMPRVSFVKVTDMRLEKGQAIELGKIVATYNDDPKPSEEEAYQKARPFLEKFYPYYFEEEARDKMHQVPLREISILDSCSLCGLCDQEELTDVFSYNIDIYWEKMLEEAAMPEFKLSEETRLPWLIVDLVKEWFYEATKYAYDLQTYCCMKLQVVYRYEDQVIVERIKELWSIMKEAGYIPKIDKKGDVVASAIDACRIAAGSFRTQQNKERLIRLILNPPGSSLNHPLVVAAAAVTVEYFYQRHAAAYSQYYANLYMQYLTILGKLEKS